MKKCNCSGFGKAIMKEKIFLSLTPKIKQSLSEMFQGDYSALDIAQHGCECKAILFTIRFATLMCHSLKTKEEVR